MTVGTRRLPRGRHGLAREQVVASQRGRLLEAMAHEVAEGGYARVTVAAVIRRAGVSRETFYEQFTDREDCFIAALDMAGERLVRELRQAVEAGPGEPGADPLDRLDCVLAAYLHTLASERALARTMLLEAYAAGPAAVRRRVELMDRFVDLAAALLREAGEDDRFTCEALVAAVSSMVTMRVAADDLASLPALHAPLMSLTRRLLSTTSGA